MQMSTVGEINFCSVRQFEKKSISHSALFIYLFFFILEFYLHLLFLILPLSCSSCRWAPTKANQPAVILIKLDDTRPSWLLLWRLMASTRWVKEKPWCRRFLQKAATSLKQFHSIGNGRLCLMCVHAGDSVSSAEHDLSSAR